MQSRLHSHADSWRTIGPDVADAAVQGQRRAHRAQVVVVVGDRHPEEGDDLFADGLIDEATVLADDVHCRVPEPGDQALRLDRRHLIDERRIVRHHGDQHRGAPPLGRRHACRRVDLSGAAVARRFGRQRRQVRRQERHRGIPLIGSFRERPVQERLDPGGHVGIRRRGQSRIARQDRAQHGVLIVAAERPRAGHHLVNDDRQRPDVGAAVDPSRTRLFRAHVGDCSDRRLRIAVRRVVNLGDPEIENLRRPIGKEDDVGGLDVTMDDP